MKIEHTTVRKRALDECHRLCRERNIQFMMSYHFTERINIRAVDQDQSFVGLLRAINFMLSRAAEFDVLGADGQPGTICAEIGGHRYFMRVNTKLLTCMTYVFNDHPNKPSVKGRLFRLKEQFNE